MTDVPIYKANVQYSWRGETITFNRDMYESEAVTEDSIIEYCGKPAYCDQIINQWVLIGMVEQREGDMALSSSDCAIPTQNSTLQATHDMVESHTSPRSPTMETVPHRIGRLFGRLLAIFIEGLIFAFGVYALFSLFGAP